MVETVGRLQLRRCWQLDRQAHVHQGRTLLKVRGRHDLLRQSLRLKEIVSDFQSPLPNYILPAR
jgi:hypothetical protein